MAEEPGKFEPTSVLEAWRYNYGEVDSKVLLNERASVPVEEAAFCIDKADVDTIAASPVAAAPPLIGA